MKGIILAGGSGTRLYPLTKVTNKHLLPIGSFPMIHYPITSLTKAGVTDIMIITGTEHMGDMITLLGSGKEYNCSFTFKVQDEPDGIAGALRLCEDFVGSDNCIVVLGDNIFSRNLTKDVDSFMSDCKLFFTEVNDPERFGVGVFSKDKVSMDHLISIEEKPKNPKTNLACVGIYMYSNKVFSAIKAIKKSKRGEYEITSVNNYLIKNGVSDYSVLKDSWVDAGTMDSYHRTSQIVYRNE